MNYDEALGYIHSLQVFGSVPGLQRIGELLKVLGDPQDCLQFIHVAGTNGKGSVSTMLSEIHRAAGKRVGLYTSPYVVDFRERIQLNGEYIEKEELARLTEIVKATGVHVTEFEFITALAFLYYKEKKCDLVVLEVGLGGRFDATNIIKAPLCSVITRIDLDHTDYLGDTVEKVAAEKCGIIKDGAPAVCYPHQPHGALNVIKASAGDLTIADGNKIDEIKSDLFGNIFIYKGEEYKTTLVGRHQIFNAVTAVEAAKKVGIATETDIKKGIEAAVIPARVEVLSKKPLLVLDGSHNPNGADALAAFMADCGHESVALIGMMADKDCEQFLKKIMPYCKETVTVTVFENPRSISAEDLKTLAEKYCQNVTAATSYEEAIKLATEKSGGKRPLFVCGSLYLACSLREKLKNTIK